MIAVVDYRKGNLLSVERGLRAVGADARITDDAGEIARADAIVLPGVGAFADASASMEELGQMDVIRERVREGVPFLGICLGLHLMFEDGVEGALEGGPLPRGLGLLPGTVSKLPREDTEGNAYKIPHVGWNTVVPSAYRPTETLDSSAAQQVPSGAAASGTPSCPSAGGAWVEAQCALASGQPCASEAPSLTLRTTGDNDNGAFACPLLADIASGTYFYFTHSYAAPAGSFAVARTQHSVAFTSAVQFGDAAFGVQFHPEKSSDAGAAVLRAFVRIAKEA